MSDNLTWVEVGPASAIPQQGARTLQTETDRIAIFRTLDDQVFALLDRCPHKQGPLAQGIVHSHFVTCPLHNMVFSLETGEAQGPDDGCAAKVECQVVNGVVRVGLTELQAGLRHAG
ncbi:nitrite reductase small subunit NirD [Thalassospira sp.]|uniref:nitrite reductase small subunit NirD n=1 Tax=Thalassospira sp. TaxID=1912094 RepID=UPI001B0D929B|nr:nitrite reductase small subunit NirD [Thalassospira sp.]MBO6805693.1 nitrite reductase small subunit NirD [Thalassospira sp.]MBO6842176.1 nitrite reductase small subunit NirD [Thalassospira sp.]